MGGHLSSLALAAAPVAGLAVNFVALILLRQAFASLNYLFAIILAFSLGFAVQAAASFHALSAIGAPATDVWSYFLLNALAYVALGYCYFTFTNLGATSLRIRIMRMILNSPGERASIAAIAAMYDSRDIVDARLSRLQSWGQLREQQGRYAAAEGALFLKLSYLIRILRRIVYGRRG